MPVIKPINEEVLPPKAEPVKKDEPVVAEDAWVAGVGDVAAGINASSERRNAAEAKARKDYYEPKAK